GDRARKRGRAPGHAERNPRMVAGTLPRLGRHPAAGAIVTIGSALLIAAATLTPGGDSAQLPLSCAVCDSFAGTDFVANIGLFVPLGVGLALLGLSVWRATGIALVASAAIEVVQFFLLPGRDASIRDVIANTGGAALGCAIAVFIPALVGP